MKTTNFNLLKWLCSIVMVAMGFTACKDEGPEETYSMYGTPTSDYKISATVTDENGKAIPGINVVVRGSKLTSEVIDGLILVTDKKGKIETDYFNSEDFYATELLFTDVDGPDNGGEFEDKTIRVWRMQRTQVEPQDGWYSGKFDLYEDVKLSLKPAEEPEAPADTEDNTDTEE